MHKRIIIIRHGEEPKQKKIDHIQTIIGLNNQGVIRASLMPEVIHALIGDRPYELHTYTHILNNEPTSRSYYTAQLLTPEYLYDKSDDVEHLVNNIKQSASNIIIVCWEHTKIPKIIDRLISVKPDWDKTTKKIHGQLGKDTYEIKGEQKIDLKDITIKYCSDSIDILYENLHARDYYIKPKEDVGYSLIWDIDYDEKRYKVYPGYIIKKCKKHNKRFKVLKYIVGSQWLEAFENDIR